MRREIVRKRAKEYRQEEQALIKRLGQLKREIDALKFAAIMRKPPAAATSKPNKVTKRSSKSKSVITVSDPTAQLIVEIEELRYRLNNTSWHWNNRWTSC